MTDPRPGEARAAFLKIFQATARHKHRYDVFRDFVTMAACSLHNAALKDNDREEEYLETISAYDVADQKRFPELLGLLVDMLDAEPRDILGPLYMELELTNKNAGQFFTPAEVSDMMSRVSLGDVSELLADQDFITLSEPACGAGGMVLSVVKLLIEERHDPAKRMWVQCVDIDRLAALMCYVQLSLWHVPAEVIVGDTLRWEHREVWFTPSHVLGNWRAKLERHASSRRPKKRPVEIDDLQEGLEAIRDDPRQNPDDYETHYLDWKGQGLTIRWCPVWLGGLQGHLELVSGDGKPHPISETGYRSHFVPRQEVEKAGGPVDYTLAWLKQKDDGKAVQLSLF